MKRVVRSLLLFFCTTLFMLSASVCVCVVRVNADTTGSYIVVEDCDILCVGRDNVNRVASFTNNSSEVRATSWYSSHGNFYEYRIYLVSLHPFNCSNTLNQYCSIGNSTARSSVSSSDNVTFYYTYYAVYFETEVPNNYNVPILDIPMSVGDQQRAYDYTFGENATDSVEPVNWGLIDLEGYQTQVAGQGNASINNVDVISWNDTFDTNSNDISTGNVRVRYVPGYYRATSKQNLLAQTYQDFVLDIISAVNGDVYPVSDGSASFRWGDVIGSLSIPFYSIYNLSNSTEGWLKRGWIYEVRLEIDDYIGEWQTVYSSTSSGVENDMTIVNTTVVTQETITAIQNINSINGTTNIWIINGQPVDPNPEITPPADDDEKPWWVYLLEMINNTLGIQNEYINEGTDESIEIVNNFEEDHDDLNVTVNDYDDIENTIVNDMNDNLDDLDIESDLIENNSFLSSARWVAEQYTRLTSDNPVGSILKFSLVLGFVMIFLGRFK